MLLRYYFKIISVIKCYILIM
uniref:Uncharacterized protein n=1 Tax=Anguilla anguilla TaxID=7936 RepID=A0A0E9VW68_ANGAN